MPTPIDQSTRPLSVTHFQPPPIPALRPPLPPRPVARSTSKRKPVPPLVPVEESHLSPTSTLSPPQDPALIHAQAYHPTPSLPPRPHRNAPNYHQPNEKSVTPSKKKWKLYPRSTRGRIWLFVTIVAIILFIVAVALIVWSTRRKESSNNDNGGHPLSRADGGIDIGEPGDIAKYGTGSTDHLVLQVNRSTVVTRLDPIVSPGKLSAHVHRFYGSSFVDEKLHNASEMVNLAQCSTTAVQDDKSIYWVPQLYHRALNGSLSMVPIRNHAAYYFQKAPTGVHLHPFPDNYNMVAGDPYRRVKDPTDV